MNKILALAVLAGMVGAFAPVGSVQAEESNLFYYVGGKLGYNQQFLGEWSSTRKDPADPVTNGTDKYKGNNAASMGIGLMGGIGYKIIPQFGIRGELEYMYRIPTEIQKYNGKGEIAGAPNNKFHVQTQIHTILANLYLDYYVIPSVNIYASAGVGVALIDLQNKSDVSGASFEENYPMVASFAWQAGVGVGYEVVKNVLLDLNVRYADFGAHDYTRKYNDGYSQRFQYPLSAVEVNVGVAYKF